MKKIILLLIITVMVTSVMAAVPDMSSVSDAQKMALLKSMSASDKQRLFKELQKEMGSEATQLEQPKVISQSEDWDDENEFRATISDEVSEDEFFEVCEYKYHLEYSQIVPDDDIENENNSAKKSAIVQNYEKSSFIEKCQEQELAQHKNKNLSPFGYDLFAGAPSTFAPVTEIPVPQDYVLGPGDTIKIFTYGNNSSSSAYVVNRNGVISIDGIGPLVVAGMTFTEVRQAIDDRFSTQMIGVKTSVTMGELRSIRVFVLGEASKAGSYTVSSLSTITNAIFVSGGVKDIGSLRNIQLKRNGKTITTLDLYDLLLKGDTRNDARLQPGDVIFIPTVGSQVGVAGNVKRPAIYETKNEHHLEDFIKLAGGVLSDAHLKNISIARIDSNSQRKILNANLATKQGQQIKIQAGDVINVNEVLAEIENSVSLTGHVKRENILAYYPGMRASNLVQGFDNLKEKVDLDYALIRRIIEPDNTIQVMSFNLRNALSKPTSDENPVLNVKDTVYIFEIGVERNKLIGPLIDELQQQSGAGGLFKQVSVAGRIKVAGNYPLEDTMSVIDLIQAGGGLTDAAYRLEAELTRDELDANYELQKRHIKIDLERLLNGDSSADVILRSRDRLFIKEVPNWRENNVVELLGEVHFPGEYPIKSGESLGQVLVRAGGLNDNAFPRGTLFIRKALQDKEKKYLLSLADKLEKDIALLSIEKDSAAVEVGQALLQQLREAKAVGRLVINLDSVMSNVGDEFKDVILQNGDKIFVPEKTQEVTVIGEVQFPTSHLHDGNSSREAYLQKSGGFTSKADQKRVYVVRADGSVVSRERAKWFAQSDYQDIEAGDTIVVPLEADRVRPLTVWTSVTQILSQIGIFAASAKTVGIL